MKLILYVTHPLMPTEAEIFSFIRPRWEIAASLLHPVDPNRRDTIRWCIERNVDKALQWLAWLRASFPQIEFIAPWIPNVQATLYWTPEFCMVKGCAIVERCDGIVLVGEHISSDMQRETDRGKANNAKCQDDHDAGRYEPPHGNGFEVYDFHKGGSIPPDSPHPLRISMERVARIFDEYRDGRTIPSSEWIVE